MSPAISKSPCWTRTKPQFKVETNESDKPQLRRPTILSDLAHHAMKKTLPDFSQKLVSVSLVGDKDGRAVDRPHWETQGGRLFLVGTVPRHGSTRDWCEGLVSAVAWDQVTDYLVFDSAEHYRERLRIYERRKGKI